MSIRPHGLPRYHRGPDEHGTEGEGCRCRTCRGAIAAYKRRRNRLVAYGRWEYPVDAAGTRRRVQALMRNGWSTGALAARSGRTAGAVWQMLRYERVSPATAAAWRALYDELWDQEPPHGTRFERQAAARARRHASERGWPPPLAWDDDEIDDPAAVPIAGWERAVGRERRERGLLAAEVADLLGFGLDVRQAAARLGVAPSTLTSVLSRARNAAGDERDDAAA